MFRATNWPQTRILINMIKWLTMNQLMNHRKWKNSFQFQVPTGTELLLYFPSNFPIFQRRGEIFITIPAHSTPFRKFSFSTRLQWKKQSVYTNNNLNCIFVILSCNEVIPEILFSQHNAEPEFSVRFFNTTFSMKLNLRQNGFIHSPFLKYIQCLRLLCLLLDRQTVCL